MQPASHPAQLQQPMVDPRAMMRGGQPGMGAPSSYPMWGQNSVPPSYGGYPVASPQQPAAARVEVSLSERKPYLQQTIVYTADVISGRNIATLDPVLPSSDGYSLQKIDGPVTSVRQSSNGGQEIVNRYHFALTPFREGAIELPPIRFEGTFAGSAQSGGSGQAFRADAGASLLLDVEAPSAKIDPWLPLHYLDLKASVKGDEAPAAGKPMELTVELSAIGASGEQLPSMESRLQGAGFRVYLESSRLEQEMSWDGKALFGRRTEKFTLVPQHGGELLIPQLRVDWFKVDTQTIASSTYPARRLTVAGSAAPSDGDSFVAEASSLFPGGSPLVFWGPLLTVFLLMLGYWAVAMGRTFRSDDRPRGPLAQGFAEATDAARAGIASVAATLWPARYWHRLRAAIVASLPTSFKLWFCTRCIDSEKEPSEWCHMLKFLACKHLSLPEQATLREIGEKIITSHPKAAPDKVRALVRSLDGAIYGGEPLDFEAWKRDFKKEIRPRPLRRSRSDSRQRHAVGLPELNPGQAA